MLLKVLLQYKNAISFQIKGDSRRYSPSQQVLKKFMRWKEKKLSSN